MKVAYRHFLFFLSLLAQLTVSPQEKTFNRIFPAAGKTFEHVTGMVQDGQGYMWLATKRGLFRYDGYQMTSYKHNPLDINSLASDALESIAVDLEGIIWIGTSEAGLDRYDPASGIFTHFRHQTNDPASLSSDAVFALLVDSDGILWIGAGEGLSRYNPSMGKFKHYKHQQNDSTTISSDDVISIYEDRRGTLWVATGSVYGQDKDKPAIGGLNRFDKKTGTFTRYMHDAKDEHSLISNKVKAMFEDSKGNFWVGTAGDGLHQMDRAKGTFKRLSYDPVFPEKLSRPPLNKTFARFDHITFIKEDASGAIWIGTTESGLNYYNPATSKVTHFESQKDTTGAFTGRTTWAACTSRDGILWISTLDGGLYTVNPVTWKIPFYKSTNGSINAFYEERDGTFWIGTDKGGLIKRNKQKEIVKQFMHDPANASTISSNSVQVIIKERRGNIWVGTNRGLQLFNKRKETFTHYRYNPKNNKTLSSDHISTLYEDKKGNLWVGTLRGLNNLNPSTGLITRYIFHPEDTSFFGSNSVSSVLEDRQGRLWSSSVVGGGVQRFNPVSGQFKSYLDGNGIMNIVEDARGIIWVAGNNLYQFDSRADTFFHFADPVSNIEINNIRSFLQDRKGNFWMGTSDGIFKIDRQQNGSMLYGVNYGINGNALLFGSSYEGMDGKLYFGHDDGFYSFMPADLTKGIKPPQIVISEFRLANQLVKPGKNSPLPQYFSQQKNIRLKYNQNVFSFDFAGIDFTNPGNNRHLFMLENYDNEWRQSGADHRAYYFNIPPGHYTFHVKGANSYGIWAEKSIDIIILPPWWRTWWAYTIFGLSFIGAVWAFVYYRSRALRRENRMLEEKVARRTTQLQQSLENLKLTQAQLIQSEKMASLGELAAGIAHEIQNPLNFVNNFSEVNKELIAEMKNELLSDNKKEAIAIADDIEKNLEKINSHGQRADAIVKGMLQHSRASTGIKEPTDINALADKYLRLSYHGFRSKDKSFNAITETHFDETIGKVEIIPQDMGRVLLNLFNNAFYAVNEKKRQFDGIFEPVISVSTERSGDKVQISVRDNGVGIPEKVVDKIFQPFYTTKPTGQGTGLGLSLSYDVIKAHGGEIKVETKEGEGAEFIIVLPV